MAHKLTTCTFCGVGCGLYLETTGNQVAGAYPSMSHPTNQGRICVRGWHAHEVASSPDRLKYPMLKKEGKFQEATWPEALSFIANRLEEIQNQYGPESLAFLNSPRCSNEESFLLQKLARAIFGVNNVDHGTGVYCNNSIQILLEMLGLPATTNSIGELSRSEVILVDGVDLAVQLPTIGGWIMRAKLNGARLIVMDTRRHRLAEHADFFLQLRPGTEVVLYGAMAKVLVDRGLIATRFIKRHCQNFEAFLAQVQEYDLLSAAEFCGVPAPLIEEAAVAYAQARSAALLYSTGIEARGKESIRALVNLVLLAGQIGKEGSGLYALTEQNNLQGVCDMGMLPDRLPGYQPVKDPSFRSFLEQRWQCALSPEPGLGARAVLTNRGAGQVHAVWLCRYDPVTTAFFGDAALALKQMELVIVQHLFMTGTAPYADVILPVVAFGEEKVSFTSTDRRIQLADKVIEPPPGPMPAWRQLAELARIMGADWHYNSSSEVMDEIGEIVPFYSGANYENLAHDYGRQWPCTKDKPLGTRFLFEDGPADGSIKFAGRIACSTAAFKDGPTHSAFKFIPVAKPSLASGITEDFPFALIFGHSLYYWHQNVLVKHSETLKRELRVLLLDYPSGFVEINYEDAAPLGIRDGGKIRLVAESGATVTWARVTREVRSGTIFVPFFVREVETQILGGTPEQAGLQAKPVYVRLEKA